MGVVPERHGFERAIPVRESTQVHMAGGTIASGDACKFCFYS